MSDDSNIGSWVPQLFYDLIGRVAPGSVILVSFAMILLGPIECVSSPKVLLATLFPKEVSATVLVLLGLVASYTVAFVFRGMYYMASSGWKRLKLSDGRTGRFAAKLGPWAVRYFSLPAWSDRADDFASKHDFIKQRNSSAGARITKMRAEEHMIGVLQSGWISCSIAAFVSVFVDFNMASAQLVMLAVLSGACIALEAVKRHLRTRINSAIDNHSRLLGFGGSGSQYEYDDGATA